MRLEVVEIPGREGRVAGLRYLPDRNPRPTTLLYAHGFSSGKYSMDGMASYLAGKGYPGVTFDFVGHKLGGTGGAMQAIRQAGENLQDALAWLRTETNAENIVLVGHSMGAAATLTVAAQEYRSPGLPRLAGAVCLCIGLEPSRGFGGVVGKAMLAQRSDYVTGSPALELLTELDAVVLSAAEIGPLPALFVAASQDVLLSVARVEALASLAPNASVAVIESSHLEAPDKARGTLVNWLETQSL